METDGSRDSIRFIAHPHSLMNV